MSNENAPTRLDLELTVCGATEAPESVRQEALATLERRWPHAWAPTAWHAEQIRRYVRQLEAHRAGRAVDAEELAARCRRDARLTSARCLKRLYKRLAKAFDQSPHP